VLRIRELGKAQRYGEALAAAERLATTFPAHRDVLYLVAANQRCLRRIPQALVSLERLHRMMGNAEQAAIAAEQVLALSRLSPEGMRVLPGRVLRVHYEDVVADLESNVRRVLAFCGLEFEPACLQFHRTRRNIGTPSSEQVRQPIFRSGLGQWRHYERWLSPLKAALGDALTHYRDQEPV